MGSLPSPDVDGSMSKIAPQASLGRRQQAMQERKRRLVRAAGELVAERADGNFSMVELAERGGVSPATPYNLFGSKAAVLGEVFERQIRSFHRAADWGEDEPAVRRIVGVADQLVAGISAHSHFFRNLWKALYSVSSSEHNQLLVPISGKLVRPLLDSLEVDGRIDAAIPLEAIEATLTRIFDASFEQWASQDWTTDQLRAQLRAGFALCFLGLVQAGERDQLAAIIHLASEDLPVRVGGHL